MHRFLICLLFFVVGCGTESRGKAPTDSPSVAAFKRDSGLEFEVCEPLANSFDIPKCWDCACEPESVPGYPCIMEGLDGCTPTHLHTRFRFDHSNVITVDYLVVPTATGCEVVRFYDTTMLEDSCRTVTRHTCTGLEWDEWSWDCEPVATGCGQGVVVIEDPERSCGSW